MPQEAIFKDFRKIQMRFQSDPPDESGIDYYTRFARWFFADRSTRMISPGSRVTVSDFVAEVLESGSLEDLMRARRLRPENPEILTAIGKKLIASEKDSEVKLGEYLLENLSTLTGIGL